MDYNFLREGAVARISVAALFSQSIEAKPFIPAWPFYDRLLPCLEFQVQEVPRFWECVFCDCFQFRGVLWGLGVSYQLLPCFITSVELRMVYG